MSALKIILSGCTGKMGQVIARTVAERDGCEIVAGLDRVADNTRAFPVFATADIDIPADIIIDFSHPALLQTVLALAEKRHLPVIIATTGLSDEQLAAVRALSEKVPVFFSANMSIGVNLLSALVEKAAKVLSDKLPSTVGIVIKGGHLDDTADDLLYVGGENHWINGKRIDNPNTHGTGCTFSSAIACNLALTSDKVQAVTNAKEYLAGAIAAKLDLGKGSGPLMHNYKIVEKDI